MRSVTFRLTKSTPTGVSAREKGSFMADTFTGEIHCLKCKGKKNVTGGEIVVNDKGRRMAKAKCPDCGSGINKFLPKA